MNKEQINEQIRTAINEILNETSKFVCKNLKETHATPETLLTLTKALETGLCAAQRFDIISFNSADILFQDTELTLLTTVKTITDVIIKALTDEDINIDNLMQLIKLLNVTSIAWKRLYNFGEDNPYR